MSKTAIEPSDIRMDDLIRYEYEDAENAHEYRACRNGEAWGTNGQHYLLDRPKPKVELPSEEGWYADRDGDLWRLHYDEWAFVGSGMLPVRKANRIVDVYAPFTKLEPVPATAKKVLAAVKADIVPGAMDEDSYSHVMACIEHVGQQFGVTE